MLAIALVIVAGVATYVSMQSVKHALEDSLDAYYRDYRFADGFASVRRAPESLRGRLKAVAGIEELETRVVAPVTLEVSGFDEAVSDCSSRSPRERRRRSVGCSCARAGWSTPAARTRCCSTSRSRRRIT